jgi:CDP-diacylglycerol--serine O-phosphatidyltransferase
MVIATAIAFYYEIGEWAPQRHVFILVMIYVLSFLMVSNLKYFSFKKVELFKRHPFQSLVAAVLIFVAVATAPELMGFPLMVIYTVSGILSTYVYLREKRLIAPVEEEAPPAPRPSEP